MSTPLGRTWVLALATWAITLSTSAQETVPLWPNGAPDSNGLAGPETGDGCIGNITEATLTVFHAESPDTTAGAILVAPGGGYAVVCMDHEGIAIAKWLNSIGITAGVLKYRMPNGNHRVPLQDAQQALRLMRSKARAWNVSPDKIGIMGFSAGGHLASSIGTHFDEDFSRGNGDHLDTSHRPDFMILVYPVVSMMDDIAHRGSRRGLLGDSSSISQRVTFSNHLHVSDRTPPTFLVHSSDDKSVPAANSIGLYNALLANGIATELHLFERGGHGYSASAESPAYGWVGLAESWLMHTLSLEE